MTLSSQQMARMSRLLDEALELDAAGRRTWLDSLSPDFQDLVPMLREALLGGASARVFADERLEGGGASGWTAGARVGPYELIRSLGCGGMAEVWLACRADGAFRRDVALKMPLHTRLRKDLEQRFIRERDILASLEHPNIARLYDAGADQAGHLYLVMEYVPGRMLTAWCDEHRLAVRERLLLFLQVLQAVQYAHEHQVIHRDLSGTTHGPCG